MLSDNVPTPSQSFSVMINKSHDVVCESDKFNEVLQLLFFKILHKSAVLH